jgi:peroxiredoxin (alkyl hydroperoxide reductase subunit C)
MMALTALLVLAVGAGSPETVIGAPAAPDSAPGPGDSDSSADERPMMNCPMMARMNAMKMDGGEQRVTMPLIGEKAPAFKAKTTQGPINFPDDYKGKWVVLFSHPADFTPVCTTEFITFAGLQPQFEQINTQLVGLSIDSIYAHIAWLRKICQDLEYNGIDPGEITFPLIEDIKMDVARKYGMLQPSASTTQAVRAVFIIDPEATVRAILYYPLSNGRNMQEILRLVVAMQTSDAHGVATPADWQPGDDVIVPPPGSCGAASDRMSQAKGEGYRCEDWFLCFKKLSKDKLKLPESFKDSQQ